MVRWCIVLMLAGCPRPLTTEPSVDAASIDDARILDAEMDAGDAEDAAAPDAEAPPPADCGDDDPLTNRDWAGFCGDKLDDNCTVDDPQDPCPNRASVHNYCRTGDERCPATQPAVAAVDWDCVGDPPAGVVAVARDLTGNDQVARFCIFIFEAGMPGEHWARASIENGPDFLGPDGDCAQDLRFRRYFFLSDLDDGVCPPVTVDFPTVADAFATSNHCRKSLMAASDPNVYFFAQTSEEAEAKLAVLDTAEIACLRAVDRQGFEIRPWVVQAAAALAGR